MKLDSIRTEYRLAELIEQNILPDPFDQFRKWLNEAIAAKVNEPTAMSVSTVGIDGFPDSRIVLLKDFDEQGLTFFTNYESNKGNSIKINPAIGLHFFWPELERQVRISGFAEKTSEIVSDEYFNSRPVNSRISAIISNQSSRILSREELEIRFKEMNSENKHHLKRPDNWGGFIVKPVKFEFWQGRESRLHDRILYEKTCNEWNISRLAP